MTCGLVTSGFDEGGIEKIMGIVKLLCYTAFFIMVVCVASGIRLQFYDCNTPCRDRGFAVGVVSFSPASSLPEQFLWSWTGEGIQCRCTPEPTVIPYPGSSEE
jgi:hypothetical protein